MPSQIITIERKKYATGLFWQPVADGHNARAFAQKIAKLVPGRAKYFSEYRSMVGIGSRALGHSARMPSAAAEVMDAFSDHNSFLAAFAVRQGFWVVAARNGIIIQDKLYASESLAKNEFDTLSGLPDWGILVAPGSWPAARSEEKLLDELVSGDSKCQAVPISGFGSGLFVLAALAALLAGGLYTFKGQLAKVLTLRTPAVKFNPEAAEAYKKRLAETDEMLVQRLRSAPVVAAMEMPYDALPDPALRAEQCWEAITFLMQVVPGWSQVEAECAGGSATAHLHRSFGIITDVYDFANERMPGVEVIENSDSDMVLTLPLGSLETSSRLSESGAEEIMRSINSVFQLMNAPVDVRRTVETVRGEVGPDGQIASANVVLISAASGLEPREFIRVFQDYDAVYLSSVRWISNQRKWNYEVKIYVK